MQTMSLRLFNFFLIFISSVSLSVFCQNAKITKINADTLFEHKKYREAFALYDSVLKQNKVSQDMLLKMAYVKEGQGDYTMALYYLNLYQLNYPNSLVLKKMDNLGSKHNLKGYEFTDYEYFASVYNKFSSQISLVIIAIAFVIFGYTTYKVFWAKQYSRGMLYLVMVILLFSYAFINFGIPSYKGIVSANHTFVMDGPSSGAKVVSTVNMGNRVNILKKDDVWYEVIWENKTAFIKKNHLLTIVNSRNAEQFNLFSVIYKFSKDVYKKGLDLIQDLGASGE
jgi:hypothetical protein